MRLKDKQSQRGAALLLVLMLSASMAAVMLFMSGKGRNDARMASLVRKNTLVSMEIQSTQADVVFRLMTSPLGVLGPGNRYGEIVGGTDLVKSFDGKPYAYKELEVSIQDMSGLVSLVPFNEKGFKQLLYNQGLEREAVDEVMDRLDDWQDRDGLRRLAGAENGDYDYPYLPKNGLIQSMQELAYVLDDEQLFSRLQGKLRLYSTATIVRQFTPDSLYSSLGFDPEQRNSETAEGASIYPSGRYIIDISASGDTALKQRLVLYRGQGTFKPYFTTNEGMVR
ncbi:general secretion pathway protein GspK [Pseudoalteromonas ruthenica]|uniref:general secretion pathway protein GspK n=1 Tax=Pseudoalteromonas ruthenica TaxID=151081 RepID=UPI00110B4890|nr:type II secretion system protein GspK [Pseudoalteromonas ruthenica]TMO46486.1 hypothetical protein CWC24_10320 [Pseudoalteromonas ruthenica]TMO50343.1 hypothetical protein CWC23_11465 [Pseudoalteromonas ruthenica]